MELLCLEQSLDLIGDGIVWVIAKVSGDFVCGSKDGGAGPARDVEDLLVWGLLGHLDGVNGAH